MYRVRGLAWQGRTVVCSIHTPSAKIFEMFDHVYVVANGQCIYQGEGSNIVPYVEAVGLRCPSNYNPADFIIELASGEYGTGYIAPMVEMVDNGRVINWQPSSDNQDRYVKVYNFKNNIFKSQEIPSIEEGINSNNLKFKCSSWEQFKILFRRSNLQIYRNKSYLAIRLYMHVFLGFLIGGLFYQMGNDASKTLFNFGFCFTVIIAFMYIPMMPVLLEFPTQVQLLKREHFNRWYRCNPYFFAMMLAKLPMQLLNTFLYLTITYVITDQPLEIFRILLFFLITILTSLTSESFGLLISARLSVINGVFIGPVCAVPLMLLSVYGIGTGQTSIPIFIRCIMSLNYLRYGLEGIVQSIYGFDRGDMSCPEDENFCPYKKPIYLLKNMGFENLSVNISIAALISFYIIFNLMAIMLIKNRLSVRRTDLWPIRIVSRFIKNYLNFTPYHV